MKLITFLLSTLLLPSAFANFTCKKTVDKNKVIVFVDANNSPAEIQGAAKAACDRGEAFQVIPEKGKDITESLLRAELSKLATKNIAVSSLIASGHDGGGTIHGERGTIDKYQIINSLKAAYKSKPNLLKEMKSVYMWGCWSMGPSEVEVWKNELPSIKVAAGFIDMGPLNTTRAAHSVLNDLLIKEKSLVNKQSQAELKRAIAGVTDINATLAAVYTDAACGDMYYYKTQGDHEEYASRDNPLFTPGTHFVEFDKNFDCKSMQPEIERRGKQLVKYFWGQLPLPEDKPGSAIRDIYAYMRHAAKCIPDKHILNPDRVFLLRFFDAVKLNFASTFHDLIGKANTEYVGLNDFKAALPNGKEKSALENYIAKNKHKYFNPRAENLKKADRKQIKEMISYFDGLAKQEIFRDPKHRSKVQSIKKLSQMMETYLFQLNPRCMDFMDWHEYNPNQKVEAKCR